MGVFGFRREDEFDGLILSAAARYGLDPALVKATVAIESGFDPAAYRAEPAVGDASWGLMQTLYRTARSLGYPGTPEGLLDPATSLEYGTAYLAQQAARYAHWDEGAVYAAYNSGTARKDAQGRYVNSQGSPSVQARVGKWLAYLAGYRAAGFGQPAAGPAPPPAAEPAPAPPPASAPEGPSVADWWGAATSSALDDLSWILGAPRASEGVLEFQTPEGDSALVNALLADLGFPTATSGEGESQTAWAGTPAVLLVGLGLLAVGLVWAIQK